MSEDHVERIISNPSFVGGWANYNHIEGTAPNSQLTWAIRWIAVQNGMLFWYLDEVMSAPERFVVLCHTEISFEDLSPSEFVIRLEYEGDAHKFKLNKSDELFWSEVIKQNKQIDRSPMTSEEFQMEDVDQLPASSMQIHLKGVPHVIPVSPLDNATAIANDFVQQHKLKADVAMRIESEILRTQIDACLTHQTRLRQQVSHLRRLLIDAAMFEARAATAENAVERFASMADRIQKQLGALQSRFRNLEMDREERIDEVSQLKAQLIASSDALQASRASERTVQKRLQGAVDHCHLLEGKLTTAGELFRRMKAASTCANAATAAYSLDDDLNAPHTERHHSDDTESMTSSVLFDRYRDVEYAVQTAVYDATERLTESYEKKIMLYESKAREHGLAMVSLQRDKATDKKTISSLRKELEDLRETHRTVQESHLSSDEDKLGKKSSADTLISTLNKKVKSLEESNASLQLRYDGSVSNSEKLEAENLRLAQRLQEVNGVTGSDMMKKLSTENRALTEQASRLRAEIIRLNEEIADIQSKAIQAVHAVQIMERDGLTRSPPPPPPSTTVQVTSLSSPSPLSAANRRGASVDSTDMSGGGRSSFGSEPSARRKMMTVENRSSSDSNNPKKLLSPRSLSFEETPGRSSEHSDAGRPPLSNGRRRGRRRDDLEGDDEQKGVVVELSLEEDYDDMENGAAYPPEVSPSIHPHRQSRDGITTPMDDAEEEKDGGEYEAEGEVDLSMSIAGLEMRLQEKSSSMLSPVVEDRLLRNIYHRYSLESTGMLSLSRFGRFTKEFEIAGNVAVSGRKDKLAAPMLVYGDVDVIFMTTLRKVAADVVDAPLNMVDITAPISPRHQAAFVPPGAVSHAPTSHPSTPGTRYASPSSGTQMSANQFIAAVEDLAVRLYAHVIEEKTGTVVECLPPKQKVKAIRAAMDVMMLKKIAPAADKLGLVPWDLIILDQTLTAVQSHPATAECLVAHIGTVTSWFTHYSKLVQLVAPEPEVKAPLSPMLYGAVSSALSKIGDVTATGGKKPPRAAPPPPLNIKGVSFKAVSRFFHDYGVVPYLMKEPQLYSVMQEVLTWAKGNIELLLIALPEDIRNIPLVQSEMNASATVRSKLAKKHVIGLGSFFVLFATVATQVFGDIDPEKRAARLFQWTAQSGGSYLMQQKQLHYSIL